MKLAVISSGNVPSQFANSINSVKHAQGFLQLENDVSVFSPITYQEKKTLKKINSINNFYGVSDKIIFRQYTDKIRYLKKKKPFSAIYHFISLLTLSKSDFLFDVEKRIAKTIKEEGFDFVYARSFRAPYYLIKSEVPVVVEMHSKKMTTRQINKLISVSDSEFFVGISTISEKLKEEYVKWGFPEKKILVQEDAVDLEKFDEITGNKQELEQEIGVKNKFIVTYCGSLSAGKGINQLLKVIKGYEQIKNVHFLIIGGPEKEKKALEKKIQTTNVTFLGFIENRKVPFYLKSSDALILLYDDKEKNMVMDLETTSPIKLFEYMASKKPIIATRIPTLEKIVNEEEVHYTRMNNTRDIIGTIKDIVTNKKKSEKKAERAYRKVKKYTYKERCKNILRFTKK